MPFEGDRRTWRPMLRPCCRWHLDLREGGPRDIENRVQPRWNVDDDRLSGWRRDRVACSHEGLIGKAFGHLMPWRIFG